MASPEKLAGISKALDETMNRVDSMKKRQVLPYSTRLRQHLSSSSGYLTNIVLAGCIFAVAAGRLSQKNMFEVRHAVIHVCGVACHLDCAAENRCSIILLCGL